MWVSPVSSLSDAVTGDSGPTALALLSTLYDTHAERVRAVLLRMLGPHADVDDLLQQAFEVALTRPAVVAAQGDGAGAWLCGVAVKLAQARRRNQRLKRFFGLETASKLSAPQDLAGNDAGAGAEAAQARALVYAALDTLSEKKRTVFVLFELEGLPGEAIAQLLECPVKTVWSRLAHARAEFEVALRRLAGGVS